jgi:hypothetical protein
MRGTSPQARRTELSLKSLALDEKFLEQRNKRRRPIMRPFALTLTVVLSGSLASVALAQCQRGGGAAPTATTATTSTGTAITTAIPLISSAETTRQQVQQMYMRQMETAYRQAAYMQQMRQAHEQQQAVAQAKADKRQERLTAVRERREAELARREAAKERNLARYSSRSLASSKSVAKAR